jgi:hypothetical protein
MIGFGFGPGGRGAGVFLETRMIFTRYNETNPKKTLPSVDRGIVAAIGNQYYKRKDERKREKKKRKKKESKQTYKVTF